MCHRFGRWTANITLRESWASTLISVEQFQKVLCIEQKSFAVDSVCQAPEDKERIHRFVKLGYNVGRIEDWIYHLEHSRGNNSWPISYHGNPHMQDNIALWNFLQSLNEEELRQYYSEQKYLKKYK